MKRIFVISICVFLLVGCSTKKEESLYYSLVDSLKTREHFILENDFSSLPFQVELNFENVSDEEIQYRVVIDSVTETMTNIKSLVIHNRQTSDIFPSIGVVDTSISLVPNGDNKGFILVGYLDFPYSKEEFTGEFKLYIQYSDQYNVKKETYILFLK